MCIYIYIYMHFYIHILYMVSKTWNLLAGSKERNKFLGSKIREMLIIDMSGGGVPLRATLLETRRHERYSLVQRSTMASNRLTWEW